MQLTLKTARKRRRLSIPKLAAKAGVHKSTVSRLERGETRPLNDTVEALEDALDYPHGTLKFQPQASA